MKKTALTQLIERWNEELKNTLEVLASPRDFHIKDMRMASREIRELKKRIKQATELLEVERQDLITAHAEGINDASKCLNGERFMSSETYFNETFKQ
jgi:DNA primase catalytic subunit